MNIPGIITIAAIANAINNPLQPSPLRSKMNVTNTMAGIANAKNSITHHLRFFLMMWLFFWPYRDYECHEYDSKHYCIAHNMASFAILLIILL